MKEIKSDLNIWKPKAVGDSVMGVVKSITQGQFGNNYNLVVDGSDKLTTLPAHAQLRGVLAEHQIKVGETLRVTLESDDNKNKAGQKYPIYKVEVDRE